MGANGLLNYIIFIYISEPQPEECHTENFPPCRAIYSSNIDSAKSRRDPSEILVFMLDISGDMKLKQYVCFLCLFRINQLAMIVYATRMERVAYFYLKIHYKLNGNVDAF